ncbi:collagen alpha-1(I) chain-like [Rhinopithecus roxellana]|uniref:collagen alpha-1(I) chain-like n=1 Tax=Rhinopithecus roxellana TaxID=61622 RepID=UPI001237446B|nr:collagen alpha-1(I) chain-like [Rhinopithecus roxellana]
MRGDSPSPPGTRRPGQRSVRQLRDSRRPAPLASSRRGSTYIGDKTLSRYVGRKRAPTQSHGPPSTRVRAVPSVSLAEQSRSEGGRGGRRSLLLAVTGTPPHEWVLAGPPLPHTGTSHSAGGPGRNQRPGPCRPLRGRRGEPGCSGDRPRPAGRPGPRAGPRGIAAGAKPPVPPEAETKPRRTDPGSRPRNLRGPARSRHARGRDPVARRAVSPQAAASQRSLLAVAPGPTGAQLSSRQSRGSLNNGAPGRGRRRRRRRFSPCSPLRVRLRSRSCSWLGAAAGTHNAQAHTTPPAARRPAPRPMGNELCGGRLGGTKGSWAGRRWDWV